MTCILQQYRRPGKTVPRTGAAGAPPDLRFSHKNTALLPLQSSAPQTCVNYVEVLELGCMQGRILSHSIGFSWIHGVRWVPPQPGSLRCSIGTLE